ncbi:30S ribosomal protein S3 [Candidatus Woesearchaeota archaeon]|nr:30S ribosomal protein S3 [Candidatus Woesearchaeota archaeon]
MIENKFIREAIRAYEVKEYIHQRLKKVGLSDVKLQKTPLGERILIKTSRPGLVVGRGGSNIQALTKELKEKFQLENPQIEIEEVTDYYLDPAIVAEMIANSLERYGTKGFKGIAHKALQDVMKAGARGVEITISGLVPSQKAKTWRFRAGYMKKSGDIAMHGVRKAHRVAQLKRCVIGVGVRILPPDVRLPDDIFIKEQQIVEEKEEPKIKEQEAVEQEKQEQVEKEKERKEKEEQKEKKEEAKEKKTKKKTTRKKSSKSTTKKKTTRTSTKKKSSTRKRSKK